MTGTGGGAPGARELYAAFAEREARGHSPSYRELAARASADAGLMELVGGLPAGKQQPNLLFGAVRHLGGPTGGGYPAFRAWVSGHWDRVRATVLARRTQTNEPGRCATLLPLLAALPQPLALIEVGASAGLCLHPDRYRYRYDGGAEFGDPRSPVVLDCATSGPVPLPDRLPEVAWRAGIDLDPLDVRDEDDVRWLESLVWPEQTRRLERLRGAVQVARAEPPELVRGDLNEAVRGLVARAPAGATPVVFHSAVLSYLEPDGVERFATTVRALPGHWISNEAPTVLPEVAGRLRPGQVPADRTVFVLALDGEPVALTGPHGQSLDWFGGPGGSAED
ncbi:DUF2332 domain-containing protein [Kitasatospora sp. A2-31]|uniref:DUF2332 domain-containing protein n=1 Tax=Kitasatospora sp. A2-31 TaxID=2916414 RepID=UPI001EE7FEEB|nr:DUF2332 domain-containing protein [Kitasatospora sp. A2-31]MCG6492938.1 DUF2332 domain-containing protein [Kitasatospora sp. A2-31]